MKIIAGTFRGRSLNGPKDKRVRPTTGRLRESIFSALDHRIGGFTGKKVADIFAGTGALGLEALSRGALEAIFVEKSPESLALLKKNISLLGVEGKTSILAGSAEGLPPWVNPFDVIFMDPPYGRGLARPSMENLVKGNWLAKTGVIVLECEKKEGFDLPPGLEIKKTLNQGFRAAHFIEFQN